jgi:hypothetical protein
MSTTQDTQAGGIRRRKFLKAIGIGMMVSSTSPMLPGRAAHAPQAPQRRFGLSEDRFGRLFPHLPPFAAPRPLHGLVYH